MESQRIALADPSANQLLQGLRVRSGKVTAHRATVAFSVSATTVRTSEFTPELSPGTAWWNGLVRVTDGFVAAATLAGSYPYEVDLVHDVETKAVRGVEVVFDNALINDLFDDIMTEGYDPAAEEELDDDDDGFAALEAALEASKWQTPEEKFESEVARAWDGVLRELLRMEHQWTPMLAETESAHVLGRLNIVGGVHLGSPGESTCERFIDLPAGEYAAVLVVDEPIAFSDGWIHSNFRGYVNRIGLYRVER